ncbi:PAP2 family protein [delta proteobacterium NaphS2]|nr:PAP2 family protein [delta proteobacterium NaphS2]
MLKIKWFYSYDWVIALYFIFSLLLAKNFGFSINYGVIFHLRYDLTMILMAVLSIAAIGLYTAVVRRLQGQDATLFGKVWRHTMFTKYLTMQHLYDLLHVLIALKLVLLIYCNIKQAIPRINPDLTDDILLQIDILLHFGSNPMQALVTLLNNPTMSTLIDRLYVFWYVLKAPVLVLFIILPNRKLSERFFGAYFSLWMIGGLAAILAPSLGPVYVYREWFDGVTKPIATQLQSQLITHYLQAIASPDQYRALIYEGVAAFPSLHVGVVVLFALFLSKVRRFLCILMWIYAVIVQIGSVVLGWHYAIDGYFAAMLAFILYRAFTNDLAHRYPVASQKGRTACDAEPPKDRVEREDFIVRQKQAHSDKIRNYHAE